MPHSFGYRARTRYLFSRPFRQHGQLNMTNYLRTFKLGDLVTIKVNGAIVKGMPFKFYHGRTGRVWNITPRAVGVVLNKRVKGKILRKRIHVRIEHVVKSKCRDDFLVRVKKNQEIAAANKRDGTNTPLIKRQIEGPRPGYTLSSKKFDKVIDIAPAPYVEVA
ncbi:ribosomal protein L21 [Acrasis kona]|uniref:Ribosomal protein L21 n=1 Tax=Acrasis kona TaxID=1008807 RepID=A0AAW2ZDX0_9EUKA